MATHEPADDMAQEVERQLQLAIAAATLAARKAITARQTTLAQLHAQSETQAAAIRAQLDRQRTLASARIQAVFDQAWWQNASPAQVAEMWQQTAQWRQPDPSDAPTIFDRAAQRIQQESRDRWHAGRLRRRGSRPRRQHRRARSNRDGRTGRRRQPADQRRLAVGVDRGL